MIPSLFRAGDTVRWRIPSGVNWLNESVTNADYTCTAYLRFNASGEAKAIVGTDYTDGWAFVTDSLSQLTPDGIRQRTVSPARKILGIILNHHWLTYPCLCVVLFRKFSLFLPLELVGFKSLLLNISPILALG